MDVILSIILALVDFFSSFQIEQKWKGEMSKLQKITFSAFSHFACLAPLIIMSALHFRVFICGFFITFWMQIFFNNLVYETLQNFRIVIWFLF